MRRRNSGQSHRSSSWASPFPARLTGWQGKPPAIPSTRPSVVATADLISNVPGMTGTPMRCS